VTDSTCEAAISELLDAVVGLRGTLALHDLEIRKRLAHLDPFPPVESFHNIEFHRTDSELPTLSGFVEIKISGVANVWWIRVFRVRDSGWRVGRFVEVYPEVGDEYVAHELDEAPFNNSKELAAHLVSLARELLAIPPPSLTT
jgi:hypothetical protein